MEHWDARLTPKGEEQCAALKTSIRGDGVWGYTKPLNLDLVVVSPLTRCLQTAVLSLGDPSGAQAILTTAHPNPNPSPSPSPGLDPRPSPSPNPNPNTLTRTARRRHRSSPPSCAASASLTTCATGTGPNPTPNPTLALLHVRRAPALTLAGPSRS